MKNKAGQVLAVSPLDHISQHAVGKISTEAPVTKGKPISSVNPARAEESACTRELRDQGDLLSHPRLKEATVADVNIALGGVYYAIERVSRRVDVERAARHELLRILSGLARHEGIRDQVIDLVAAMERGE